MNWHTIALPLVVISVVFYHMAQKNIPKDANPLVAVAVAYAFVIFVCLAGVLLSGDHRKGAELLRSQNWTVVAILGVAASGIELGFLYAYRAGWKVSTMATTSGTFITIALAFVGVLWFKETLTVVNVIGIVLCILGVVLINSRLRHAAATKFLCRMKMEICGCWSTAGALQRGRDVFVMTARRRRFEENEILIEEINSAYSAVCCPGVGVFTDQTTGARPGHSI